MLKWVALILVASVLCWGDTVRHESQNSREGVIDRVTSEPSKRPSRPVVEEKQKTDDSIEPMSAEEQAQLGKLLEEFDSVTAPQTHKVGEQTQEVN